MGNRPSCRSCRHCVPPKGAETGWCHLRQLAIHPELVGDLWCHHWTARPPRLPRIGDGGQPTLPANRQLVLTNVLTEM